MIIAVRNSQTGHELATSDDVMCDLQTATLCHSNHAAATVDDGFRQGAVRRINPCMTSIAKCIFGTS